MNPFGLGGRLLTLLSSFSLAPSPLVHVAYYADNPSETPLFHLAAKDYQQVC